MITKSAHVDFIHENLMSVYIVKINILNVVPEHLTPKLYVDKIFAASVDESSLVKNNQDNDSTNCCLLTISDITPKSEPTDDIHIAHKTYVESLSKIGRNGCYLSLAFNDQDIELANNILTIIYLITLNRNSILDDGVANKKYNDDEVDKNTVVINNLDNNFFDTELLHIDSVQIKRNTTPDIEVVKEKYVADTIQNGTFFRFSQTLENYIEVPPNGLV